MDHAKTLTRIVFLIHPMGHVHDDPLHPYFLGNHQEYLAYCEATAHRWRDAISEMTSADALFMIPSRPPSPEMDQLQTLARQKLGDRCIVAHDLETTAKRHEPVDGRYYEKLGKGFLARVGEEVIRGVELRRGFRTKEAIGTAIGSLAYVEDLWTGLSKGGHAFDPGNVKIEAWGQAFEGCVAKYSAMIGRYLDLPKPVEIDFNMCIPDARFAWLHSRFIERLLLEERFHLFLFETDEGEPFALFLDGFHALSEDFYVAEAPIDPASVMLANKCGDVRRPADDGNDHYAAEGRARIPVGIGLHADNESLYIFARGMTPADLREALIGAKFLDTV